MFEGSAPNTIEKHYRVAYKAGIEAAFQQFDSKLLPYFERTTQEGEFDYYDRISIADDMQLNATRFGQNPHSDMDYDRRRTQIFEYENGHMLDPKDLARVANDPSNEITRAFLAAAHRKLDDIIIEGLFSRVYTGKKGEQPIDFVNSVGSGKIRVGDKSKGNTTPIATGGVWEVQSGAYEGIQVAADYTGTGTAADSGLTLKKLRAVRSAMVRMEAASLDEPLNVFITEKQFDDLLGINEVVNADFAIRKALAEGKVTEYGGFRFIHCQRLPFDANGKRRCVVAKPKALKLAIGKNIKADMWNLPNQKNIPYMYFSMSAGATRMWGELLAEVKCSE